MKEEDEKDSIEIFREVSFNTLNYGVTIRSNMLDDTLEYMRKEALFIYGQIKEVEENGKKEE